ncbi:MAG TPA: DUF4349 domain-containing protein [Gemmatimonadaceae bacterium]|nr:DUF4349 domain-containing protein [Gemmatimonadaceae bacterium]
MSANVRVALSLVIVVTTAAACDGKSDSVRSARRAPMDQAVFSVAAPAPARADSLSVVELSAPPLGLVRNASLGGRPAAAHQSTEPASATQVVPGSMLVRTGKASLQVESLETGIGRIRDMARRTGAVIANTSMEGGKEQTRAASLELRIPSDRFDEAVNGLSPIGKLESVNVSVEDVGEEFVDVQARMVNARRLEQRLIELLANRTGKLTDVLKVEGELARVREEIERYEGRLRYLHSRSSVSTLTIAVHESYPIVADAGSHPMRDAFAQAGRNLVSVTAGLIASLGVIIPIGVLLGALLLIGRRFLATHGLRIPEKASGAERA